jgi:hypothetical protein
MTVLGYVTISHTPHRYVYDIDKVQKLVAGSYVIGDLVLLRGIQLTFVQRFQQL